MEPEEKSKPAQWDISQGDYKLAEESRKSYDEKIRRKKFLVKLVWIAAYLVAVALIAILLFSN